MAAQTNTAVILRSAPDISRARVSKDGSTLRACGHPSRRPFACANGLLRVTPWLLYLFIIVVAAFTALAQQAPPTGYRSGVLGAHDHRVPVAPDRWPWSS